MYGQHGRGARINGVDSRHLACSVESGAEFVANLLVLNFSPSLAFVAEIDGHFSTLCIND